MRIRLGILGTTMATVALLAPAGASASTVLGNDCQANVSLPSVTVAMIGGAATAPHPIVAPADGVVTSFAVNLPASAGTFSQKLKVFRRTSVLNELQTVAQSPPQSFSAAVRSANTQVPIKAGDLIGLGASSVVACSTTVAADTIGQSPGDSAVGTKAVYSPTTGGTLPLLATVEPDIDGDGFGDETQDACVRSKSTQAPCPEIELDSFSLGEKAAVKLLVSSSVRADVTVSATAKLPKAKKGGGRGKRAAKTVSLGPLTQTVDPPVISIYTLEFPKSLKSALAKLEGNRSIKLTTTAAATDATGLVSTSTKTLKLKRP